MKTLTKKKLNEVIKFAYEQFYEITETVPYINRGGCGVFAEELYKVMDKIGLNPKLVILTRDKESAKDVIKNYGNSYDAPFSHVMVKVNGKLIDCGGIYKNHKETNYSHCELYVGMPIDLLSMWNADQEGWNPTYNRRYIPMIKKRFIKIEEKLVRKYLVVSK